MSRRHKAVVLQVQEALIVPSQVNLHVGDSLTLQLDEGSLTQSFEITSKLSGKLVDTTPLLHPCCTYTRTFHDAGALVVSSTVFPFVKVEVSVLVSEASSTKSNRSLLSSIGTGVRELDVSPTSPSSFSSPSAPHHIKYSPKQQNSVAALISNVEADQNCSSQANQASSSPTPRRHSFPPQPLYNCSKCHRSFLSKINAKRCLGGHFMPPSEKDHDSGAALTREALMRWWSSLDDQRAAALLDLTNNEYGVAFLHSYATAGIRDSGQFSTGRYGTSGLLLHELASRGPSKAHLPRMPTQQLFKQLEEGSEGTFLSPPLPPPTWSEMMEFPNFEAGLALLIEQSMKDGYHEEQLMRQAGTGTQHKEPHPSKSSIPSTDTTPLPLPTASRPTTSCPHLSDRSTDSSPHLRFVSRAASMPSPSPLPSCTPPASPSTVPLTRSTLRHKSFPNSPNTTHPSLPSLTRPWSRCRDSSTPNSGSPGPTMDRHLRYNTSRGLAPPFDAPDMPLGVPQGPMPTFLPLPHSYSAKLDAVRVHEHPVGEAGDFLSALSAALQESTTCKVSNYWKERHQRLTRPPPPMVPFDAALARVILETRWQQAEVEVQRDGSTVMNSRDAAAVDSAVAAADSAVHRGGTEKKAQGTVVQLAVHAGTGVVGAPSSAAVPASAHSTTQQSPAKASPNKRRSSLGFIRNIRIF